MKLGVKWVEGGLLSLDVLGFKVLGLNVFGFEVTGLAPYHLWAAWPCPY
jgi:hypothetical protein